MKAMILAAGRGTRMGPLTDNVPKPLLKVGGFTLIEHLLFSLAGNGFRHIVINVAYLGQRIMELLGDGHLYGVEIQYSPEEEVLETGGGIFNALPLLGSEPFLVVSADIWTDFPYGLLADIVPQGLAHIVLVDNPVYNAAGDFNLLNAKLVLNGGLRLTYGNIGIYHPDLFKDCKPGRFPLGPLLHSAVQHGMVTGEHYQGEWSNIGTPEILNDVLKKYALLTK